MFVGLWSPKALCRWLGPPPKALCRWPGPPAKAICTNRLYVRLSPRSRFVLLRQVIQVDAVNGLFKNFRAFDTSNKPSTEAEAEYKPDVTIYEKKKGYPKKAITSFQKMEMFIEFKHGNSSDPFKSKDGSFPKTFNSTSVTRGQLALYATRQQGYQFRTWIISVGIFGPVARLFRWDRTGCQVTDPIELSSPEGSMKLTEFFIRLDRMAGDREARGWDPTVQDPTGKEIRDFDLAIKAACGLLTGAMTRSRTRVAVVEQKEPDPMFSQLVESVGNHNEYPRRKVSVGEGDTLESYIVGRPTSMPKSPTGRATRGFVALSTSTGRLVFLKDSWRPDLECTKPEDHWFQQLNENGSGKAYIGAYSLGSDVYATRQLVGQRDLKQRTITHHYAKGLEQMKGMLGYIHYRVVQTELYLPLETFRGSEHLVDVMDDIGAGVFL
jgi:hypothetical protein